VIVPLSDEKGWSQNTQGLVLSSFYWGYICLHFVGGWLANKFTFKVSNTN